MRFDGDAQVLLPSYLGWTPREGSGVFDPIKELGFRYSFYRVDSRLNIDLDHLEKLLSTKTVGIVILVHYFGRVDPNARVAAALARDAGALVIEDSAHAMLTDLVYGRAGDIGDVSLFSLHKLLAVPNGGLLMFNRIASPWLKKPEVSFEDHVLPWHFDLQTIAKRRVANAEFLGRLTATLVGEAEPLWTQWATTCVPQTFPVLVKAGSRDLIHSQLNSRGFGAVSLYYQLVDEVLPEMFPEAHEVSSRILNLPIHQDLDEADITALVTEFQSCLAQGVAE